MDSPESMKPQFRFPLWMVPVCWGVSVLLGSTFVLILMKQLIGAVNTVPTFLELGIRSSIVASPALICSVAAVFLMNRYPRGIWKYTVGLAMIQLFFGYMVFVSGTDMWMMTVYSPIFIAEKVGYLPPILLYCTAGWIVYGIALWIVRKKQVGCDMENVIDHQDLSQ